MLTFNDYYNKVKPIEIKPGAEVEGKDFFGRKKELKILKEKILKKGTSIIIPGPRRWGKSSFVKEFRRKNKKYFKFVYLQLQNVNSIKEFYIIFLKEICKLKVPGSSNLQRNDKLTAIINKTTELISEITLPKGGVKLDKIKSKDSFSLLNSLSNIIKFFPEMKIIIFLDEIADFIIDLEKKSGLEEFKYFLKWLRVSRQELKVQMIFSSSINISSIIERNKVEDLVNDIEQINLKPLSEEESIYFFVSLLKSQKIKLDGEVFKFCVSKLKGGIHYFIQILADGIYQNHENNKTIIDIHEMENIYNQIININIPSFHDFRSRIEKEEKHFTNLEQSAAKKILANLSKNQMDFDDLFALTADILSDKSGLHKLLKRLCDEGYLIKSNSNYNFVSTLLADYWNKNYFFEK